MRPQTRPVVVQPKQQENFKPVSILSSSKSHDWSDMSNSALKMFEASNKRWAAENNVENNFLVPSFNTSTQSLFKDNKFDNFSNRIMTPMFQDHPIKIETFVTESDRYVLTLDVRQFKAEEIQVKVADETISVSGKHEEKQDEGNFSYQEYSRKHSLPPGVRASDVKCVLSSDGILTITAPRKEQPALQQSERTIAIKHSGLPAIRV